MVKARRRKRTLPPHVFARVNKRDGITRYRSWAPTGANGAKRWTKWVATPEDAVRYREEMIRLDRELPRDLLTLEDGIQRVLKRLKQHRRQGTVDWFESQLRRIRPFFGKATLLERITARNITRFRDELQRETSASTVHHHRRALSMIFSECLASLLRNPLKDVRGWPRLEQKRMAFLTPERITQLVAKIRASADERADHDADIVSVLFLTGLRRSELARLKVEDIDFEQRTAWIVGKVKNETMAVGPEAAEVLERMAKRVDGDGLLLPDGVGTIAHALRKWRLRLKEPALAPHVLRHSFVSAKSTTEKRINVNGLPYVEIT
jgi:integrase